MLAAASTHHGIGISQATWSRQQAARPARRLVVAAEAGSGGSGGKTSSDPNPGLGLKAVWHGAEALGNVIGAQQQLAGSRKRSSSSAAAAGSTGLTREQAIAAIKADYSQNYFVSGTGDLAAYAPDCYFADPFAGFSGTQRFKSNVSNLGSLLQDIQLDITGWSETESELVTKWRFSAILDLPWRPRLAAAGGTTHVFDEDNRVVKHVESWDVDPARVVRSLLKPSAKVPTTFAEVLCQSLHDGDLTGAWFCFSSGVLKAAGAASIALLLLHIIRGEGQGEGSTPNLYSLHASEWQQQHYLLSVAARRAAAEAEAEAGVGDRYAPIEPLAAGDAYEAPNRTSRPRAMTLSEDEEAAAVQLHCAQCGPLSEPDFYEGSTDVSLDNQLVLRSTWLCSGASSLADMRQRLEERIRFLADLERDGWELMEAVDDEYACLHNRQPKPRGERRLAEAWEIVERWEEGVEWERWPGPSRSY
ncbi:SOUL heme-binding [Chlorella sorokiniana]|uniref:SOUL heme-binding n=1 Tax=Chlorella sorokiniana TaxID=3076 RepID=A0A2P6TY80_CHLSO|nr:SOUL heme-binding [Chlorella sorokiniana]|eukprot:PRW59024.1 SOUL heme-binding [Chlorella sorokiniana]